jgi:hypothetical protein
LIDDDTIALIEAVLAEMVDFALLQKASRVILRIHAMAKSSFASCPPVKGNL